MTTPKPEEPEIRTAKDAPAAEEPKKPEEPRTEGLKYVFKIAPADPKNAFDFEDVADK